MRSLVRLWASWLGKRVHPVRLGLESLAAAWALWPISVLLYVFASRLFYPMDLEWCEGGTLYQAYRWLHGLPVYVRNDPTWLSPMMYPPLHTAVLTVVGLLHLDFWTGRLVSVFSFFVLCGVLFHQAHVHAAKSSYGVATGTLTVATVACAFPLVGQWYDLIRVDTMTYALAFLGVALVGGRPRGWRHTVLTATVLTAAAYSKQTAAFFVAWACLFALVREPRSGLRLGALTLAMGLVTLGLLQWSTDGAFWFFTVTDLQVQQVDDRRLVDALRQVTDFAPFVALVPAAILLLALRRLLSERTVLWTGALLAAVPASSLPYAKVGGFSNNLMPMATLVGLVAVLLATDLANKGGKLGALARWGTLAGLALFVWLRPLKPAEYIPDQAMRRAANELTSLVRSLEGGVLVPELAFLPARTGHTNLHWYTMSIYCALLSKRPVDMVAALEKSGVRWALLNSQDRSWFIDIIRSRFRRVQRIPDTARVRMMTGAPISLDELWERVR